MPNDDEKTLNEQIDDLLEDIPAPQEDEGSEEVDEEVEEQEEVEETPVEDATEVEEEEEPEEDLPEEVEEGDDEVEEVEGEEDGEGEEEPEEPEDEVAEVDELAEYRDRLNKIAEAALRSGVKLPADLLEIPPEEVTEPTGVQQPEALPEIPQTPTPASYDDFDILMEGVNFDDFMDNEEQFVQGMRGILSRHEQMLSQRFMTTVPSIVQNQVQQITTLQKATENFYSENEDLRAVRPTVGAVANQIADRHPDWSIDKIMEESAKSTRKLLRLPEPGGEKPGKKTVRKKKVNPSFAKSKGASVRNKPKQKLSKQQRQMDELLEDY